jgi:molybdate transport system substrate-binding protein
MLNKFSLLLIILLLFPATSNAVGSNDLPQVTILAASSISEPLTQLTRIYSKEHNIIVTASFDGSAEQARKIEQGEQADIFLSSHPFWMSVLKQKGLIDVYSLTNLVRNKLTLTISTKSSLNAYPIPGEGLAAKLSYLNGRIIMVMGDFDESSLGLYTKQVIQNTDAKEHTSLWMDLSNKIIPSPSAKNALYLISHGETAGITYYSDSYNNKEVNVLNVIDDSLHEPIIYQAAVVAGENMTAARDFLEFLRSDQAKRIYKKYGFIID